MKKILFFSVIFFNSFLVLAQQKGTTRKALLSDTVLVARPYAEFGINTFLNRKVVENYQTNSAVYWALGIRFGNPALDKVNVIVQYSQSKTSISHLYPGSTTIRVDSTLQMKQLAVGCSFPIIVIGDKAGLRSRVAITLSDIDDSYYTDITEFYFVGCSMGLGLERKIKGNSKVYIEGSYNYIRMNGAEYYDANTHMNVKGVENMNTFKLTFGLNL